MKYYVDEKFVDARGRRNAASKAREDVRLILEAGGYTPVEISPHFDENGDNGSTFEKIRRHRRVARDWRDRLASLSAGDELVVQFPPSEQSLFLPGVFKDLAARGVRIVLVLHDLETLRLSIVADETWARKSKGRKLETAAIAAASQVVVHNDQMRARLESLGVPGDKLVSLGIFDYLIPDYDADRMAARELAPDLPLIVAGNLTREKAAYLYDLPAAVELNLYGNGFDETGVVAPNLHLWGSFPPDDLPYALAGSFGLVWDGETSHGCAGVFGEYLRINNPHKTSLYLASGIPVAIWSGAALADFVTSHQCGIVVDDVADIPAAAAALGPAGYESLRVNADRIGSDLRAGRYLARALAEAESRL